MLRISLASRRLQIREMKISAEASESFWGAMAMATMAIIGSLQLGTPLEDITWTTSHTISLHQAPGVFISLEFPLPRALATQLSEGPSAHPLLLALRRHRPSFFWSESFGRWAPRKGRSLCSAGYRKFPTNCLAWPHPRSWTKSLNR